MVRTLLALTVIGTGAAVFAGDPSPIVIGHRGASGHRPEHTLAAYRLAAEMGADYIEPDLVVTKDGVLVARHENEIGGTTDAADRFPSRKTTRRIDGRSVSGWFAEDFTLAELKTLRARERLPFRSHAFDGQFEIPTLDEVIALARRLSTELHRTVGIYPETKHPAYLRGIGLPLEDRLVSALKAHDWNGASSPVFVQSFERGSLRIMRGLSPVRLIQLIDEPSEPLTDARLHDIASYAQGLGLNSRLIVPLDKDRRTLSQTDIVARAHAAHLLVHVWTLRREPEFLSPSYEGKPEREYQRFRDLGVDGIFTDFPDEAVDALRR